MPNTQDHVTGSEFARYIAEEHNYRERLERRTAEQHLEYMNELREIKATVKSTNGRVGTAELKISVIEREIGAIKSEDNAIEQLVTDVRDHGCKRLAQHSAILGSGALPAQDDEPQFRLPSLSRRQKVAAGAGVGALLLPAFLELVQMFARFVSWLEVHRKVME